MNNGYRAKKRYGQNFLHERKYIDDILAAAAPQPDERVFEIGPGLGALTDPLLARSASVDIVEFDRDLVSRWQQRVDPGLNIHAGDALDLDWRAMLADPPYLFVANLPYNISSQVLFRLLDHRDLFSRAVLMFQKEVGERICAAPATRDYGILSVLCQMVFDVESVVVVPSGAFRPSPQVDSVVLFFRPLPQPRFEIRDETFFRRVVKASFGQRRKTLRNSLRAAGFTVENIDFACQSCAIDPARRGETLKLDEFACLANRLQVENEKR